MAKNYKNDNGWGFVTGTVESISPDRTSMVIASEEFDIASKKRNVVKIPIKSTVPFTAPEIAPNAPISAQYMKNFDIASQTQQNIALAVFPNNHGYQEVNVPMKNGMQTYGFLTGPISKAALIRNERTGKEFYQINITVDTPVGEKETHIIKVYNFPTNSKQFNSCKNIFDKIPVDKVPCTGAFIVEKVEEHRVGKDGKEYSDISVFSPENDPTKTITCKYHMGFRSMDTTFDSEKLKSFFAEQKNQTPAQPTATQSTQQVQPNVTPTPQVATPVQTPVEPQQVAPQTVVPTQPVQPTVVQPTTPVQPITPPVEQPTTTVEQLDYDDLILP